MSNESSPAGYSYGQVGPSPVTLDELKHLLITVGLTPADFELLNQAGEVLADQTAAVVAHWRSGIIAGIPHLARHSRSLEGQPLPDYLARSNARFQQWILDTCRRPYDQEWLDHQHEIALRHLPARKNQTDGVVSTTVVPFRDIMAFAAVMNETIKPYLAAKGHAPVEVDRMHTAWCKSLQLQIALWAKTYFGSPEPSATW